MKYRFLRFPEGKTKAVTFSYDDGCRDDLRLAEVLDAYGLKGTFNIPSGTIAEESGGWNLTEQEIREHILNKGHEVATHGQWHKAMGLVRPMDGIKDVLNCRLELEKRFGGIIRGMAYSDSGKMDLKDSLLSYKISSSFGIDVISSLVSIDFTFFFVLSSQFSFNSSKLLVFTYSPSKL